jgi:hypothetical protein
MEEVRCGNISVKKSFSKSRICENKNEMIIRKPAITMRRGLKWLTSDSGAVFYTVCVNLSGSNNIK